MTSSCKAEHTQTLVTRHPTSGHPPVPSYQVTQPRMFTDSASGMLETDKNAHSQRPGPAALFHMRELRTAVKMPEDARVDR